MKTFFYSEQDIADIVSKKEFNTAKTSEITAGDSIVSVLVGNEWKDYAVDEICKTLWDMDNGSAEAVDGGVLVTVGG